MINLEDGIIEFSRAEDWYMRYTGIMKNMCLIFGISEEEFNMQWQSTVEALK